MFFTGENRCDLCSTFSEERILVSRQEKLQHLWDHMKEWHLPCPPDDGSLENLIIQLAKNSFRSSGRPTRRAIEYLRSLYQINKAYFCPEVVSNEVVVDEGSGETQDPRISGESQNQEGHLSAASQDPKNFYKMGYLRLPNGEQMVVFLRSDVLNPSSKPDVILEKNSSMIATNERVVDSRVLLENSPRNEKNNNDLLPKEQNPIKNLFMKFEEPDPCENVKAEIQDDHGESRDIAGGSLAQISDDDIPEIKPVYPPPLEELNGDENEESAIRVKEGIMRYLVEGSSDKNDKKFKVSNLVCNLCGIESKIPAAKKGTLKTTLFLYKHNHIFRYHLTDPLYECYYCRMSVRYEMCPSKIKKHLRDRHPDKPPCYLDNLETMKPRIRELLPRCFPQNPPDLDFMQKFYCAICEFEYSVARKLPNGKILNRINWQTNHILDKHLDGRAVFRCNYCNLSYYRLSARNDMIHHCASKHPGQPLEYSDSRKEISNEVRVLLPQCFPYDCHGLTNKKKKVTKHKKEPVLKMEPSEEVSGIGGGGGEVVEIFCQKCERMFMPLTKNRVKWKTDHICKYHLMKPIFKCNLCPFNVYCSADNSVIQRHMFRIHPTKSTPYEDHRKKLNNRVQLLMFECFG